MSDFTGTDQTRVSSPREFYSPLQPGLPRDSVTTSPSTVFTPGKEVYATTYANGDGNWGTDLSGPSRAPPSKGFLGTVLRKRFIVPIVLLLIAIVVAVPTAVVLTRRRNQSSPLTPAPATETASWTSLSVLANYADNDLLDSYDSYDLLVYQADSDRIKAATFSAYSTGDGVDIGVTDARSGTPLASTSQPLEDGSKLWWIFYVDRNNKVRGVFSTEDLDNWRPGNIDSEEIEVPSSNDIAFTVGHHHFNRTSRLYGGDLSFFVCTADEELQEYILDADTLWWRTGFRFGDVNGCRYATVAETTEELYVFTRASDSDEYISTWYQPHGDVAAGYLPAATSNFTVPRNNHYCVRSLIFCYQNEDRRIEALHLTFTSITLDGTLEWSPSSEVSSALARDQTPMACGSSGEIASAFYQMESGRLIRSTALRDEPDFGDIGDWSAETLGISDTLVGE